MNRSLQAFFSNKTECLYHRLKSNLYTGDPFAKRFILVPSPAMKSWLMMQLAIDPDVGIAAGLEICFLDEGLQKISKFTEELPAKQLSRLELTLALEKEIHFLWHEQARFSDQEKILFTPLLAYLGKGSSRKREKRITALSETLSELFWRYGIYGGETLKKWEKEPPSNWQLYLWKKIFSKWDYPYRSLSQFLKKPFKISRQHISIHLFAISYLPTLYHHLFDHFSKVIPVKYYILSPCEGFWSDSLSEKKAIKWKAQPEILKNSLLTNLGKVGQQMALLIENSEADTKKDFLLSENLESHPAYQDLMHEELLLASSKNDFSLLEALQSDLVLQRVPETAKLEFSVDDASLKVDVAPTKKREVEILYNNLIQLIQKNLDSHKIYPGNIVVMCPDIDSYAPFIESIFNKPSSLLKAQVFDLNTPGQADHLKGFLHLLKLPAGRWETSSLLHLFECQSFLRKFDFSGKEFAQIREWISATGVSWGTTAEHRNKMLVRDHGSAGMVEKSSVGTWEFAFARIFSGLVLKPTAGLESHLSCFPLNILEESDKALFSKFCRLIHSLHQDLIPIENNELKSLDQWIEYLRSIFEKYFALNPQDDYGDHPYTFFEQLRQAEIKISISQIPFNTILHHFEACLNRPNDNYHDGNLNAVRFCAMLPMRAIPADVIVLMGLDEAAYPRQHATHSFDLLSLSKDSDYCPTSTEYDRYLFLEAILSARRHLWISYCGYDSSGKQQNRSILVSELLSYMDQAYSINGDHPSRTQVVNHPYFSFDPSYFKEMGPLPNYSQSHYLACKALFVEKNRSVSFIPRFEISDKEMALPSELALKDLNSCVKNPLKFFFNKTLSIYFEKNEPAQDHEKFLLSNLDLSSIKKTALEQSLDTALERDEKSGRLPVGPFKNLSISRLRKDFDEREQLLAELNMSSDQCFKIILSNRFEGLKQDHQGDYQISPYIIKGTKITGTLQNICPQGMLVHIKDEKKELYKIWPEYLLLCSLIQKYRLPILPQLILTKGAKLEIKQPCFEDPELLLHSFFEYFALALKNPSPLIPEWITPILKFDQQGLQNALNESLTNPFHPIYNEYLLWIFQEGIEPDATSIIEWWQPHAKKIYGSLYEAW